MNNNNDYVMHLLMKSLFGPVKLTESDLDAFVAYGQEEQKLSRQKLECHPSIKTNVTDSDMLLIQIDIALEMGDEMLFMLLTQELEEMDQ